MGSSTVSSSGSSSGSSNGSSTESSSGSSTASSTGSSSGSRKRGMMNVYEKCEYLEQSGWKFSDGCSAICPWHSNSYVFELNNNLERLIDHCYAEQLNHERKVA
jgi:hypothetical protein